MQNAYSQTGCVLPLAITTVPMQEFRRLLDAQTALCRGTVFGELVLPFCGSEVNRHGSR